MAQHNKRLSGSDRDIILNFASRQIAATADNATLDAAYEVAADAVHAVVLDRWPQKDMCVLAKYDAAHEDACVYVSTGGSNYDRFIFREGDKRIALRPNRNCSRQPIMLEGPAEKAYRSFRDAEEQSKTECNQRINDFKALIYGTLTFNALVEVWPALEALRTTICGSKSAVSILSADVVSRVQNDAAFAAEVTA